jgi:hypothetical protein
MQQKIQNLLFFTLEDTESSMHGKLASREKRKKERKAPHHRVLLGREEMLKRFGPGDQPFDLDVAQRKVHQAFPSFTLQAR